VDAQLQVLVRELAVGLAQVSRVYMHVDLCRLVCIVKSARGGAQTAFVRDEATARLSSWLAHVSSWSVVF
jgi:hypothetical protein